MTDKPSPETEKLRRELTKQVGILWRRRHEKEAWLAADREGDRASRIIASAEIIAYETQIGLIQVALNHGDEIVGFTCHAPGVDGSVQGHGMFADASEIGTARLVKAVREAWPFAQAPLPWSWSSIPAMGGVHHLGRLVSQGRFLLADVPGAVPGPMFLAYMARAAALFPALVREVVALRIAHTTMRNGERQSSHESAIGAAQSLIFGDWADPADGVKDAWETPRADKCPCCGGSVTTVASNAGFTQHYKPTETEGK